MLFRRLCRAAGSWCLVERLWPAITTLACVTGCATHNENLALGALGATVLGAQAPTHEMQAIYYLGVFDPQDQLPPMVYRVRVHGQASFISRANFASGWVRAELIDSLSGGGHFEGNGVSIDASNALTTDPLQTGRRLVMFGPEGFREAPRNHRLVVVMGSDPSGFFTAMDKALGQVTSAQGSSQNRELLNQLVLALTSVHAESDRLDDLVLNVATTFPPAH